MTPEEFRDAGRRLCQGRQFPDDQFMNKQVALEKTLPCKSDTLSGL